MGILNAPPLDSTSNANDLLRLSIFRHRPPTAFRIHTFNNVLFAINIHLFYQKYCTLYRWDQTSKSSTLLPIDRIQKGHVLWIKYILWDQNNHLWFTFVCVYPNVMAPYIQLFIYFFSGSAINNDTLLKRESIYRSYKSETISMYRIYIGSIYLILLYSTCDILFSLY